MEPFGYHNSHHKPNSTIAEASCRKYKTRTKQEPAISWLARQLMCAPQSCSRLTLWQAVRTDLGKKAFSSPKALK